MKKEIILCALCFFGFVAGAETDAGHSKTFFSRCEELIKDAVIEEAKIQGKETPEYELSEPIPQMTQICIGRTENQTCPKVEIPDNYEYSSSVFIVDDGYIPNSGIRAEVVMNKYSCNIINLHISF